MSTHHTEPPTATTEPEWLPVEMAPRWRNRACPEVETCTIRFGEDEHDRFLSHWRVFHKATS